MAARSGECDDLGDAWRHQVVLAAARLAREPSVSSDWLAEHEPDSTKEPDHCELSVVGPDTTPPVGPGSGSGGLRPRILAHGT